MFKVGDKVVENCFKLKYSKHWSTKGQAVGTIINITVDGYYQIRFSSFLKYMDGENDLDYHELLEKDLIPLEIYNSSLYRIMNEKED